MKLERVNEEEKRKLRKLRKKREKPDIKRKEEK